MNIAEQNSRVKAPKKSPYMFKAPDRYGYFTDLNHPVVLKEYQNFKKKLCLASMEPLTDDQRNNFDNMMRQKYPKHWAEHVMRVYDPGGINYEKRKIAVSEVYGMADGKAHSA